MNKSICTLTLALLATAAGTAAFAEGPTTPEQVRDETLKAIRNGEMIEPSGMTPRQEFPSRYPPVTAPVGKSRAQVKAETQQAIHDGDMVEASGMTPRAEFPSRYPPKEAANGKTRAEVHAETARAIRNGDMVEPSGMTPRQEFPSEYSQHASK
jgi:hypothetical protein